MPRILAVCPTVRNRTFLELATRLDLSVFMRRKQVMVARNMADVKSKDCNYENSMSQDADQPVLDRMQARTSRIGG